jgi:hypothetical protein
MGQITLWITYLTFAVEDLDLIEKHLKVCGITHQIVPNNWTIYDDTVIFKVVTMTKEDTEKMRILCQNMKDLGQIREMDTGCQTVPV